MKNNEIVEYSKKIDSYLRGELDRKAIDLLWISFMKNPVLYEYFEIELHLKNVIKKTQKKKVTGVKVAGNRQSWQRKAVYALMAAVFLFVMFIGVQKLLLKEGTTMDHIALSKIEPGEMAAGAIFRSDENGEILLELELSRAVSEAFNHNYEAAMNRLYSLNHKKLSETQMVMIHLNLGILYFNSREYDKAEIRFLNVIESDGVAEIYEEQARWYLANTYLITGNIEEARTEARKVSLIEGRYQTKADQFLHKMEQ